MKKFDIGLLITGLVSLVLGVIMFIVTIFAFVIGIKNEVGSDSFKESFQWFTDICEEYGDTDRIIIKGQDGDTIFDLSDGIKVVDQGSNEDVEFGEVYVSSGGDEIQVGLDGIHIDSADGDKVDIG